MKHSSLKKWILAALFAALTAVFSQIALPLPFTPVPINLAILAVFLAGGLLGPRFGTISQLVYIALGLTGLPVFSQFTGGPAILFGPTGGYILGYALCALTVGLLFDRLSQDVDHSTMKSASYFAAGLFLCYLPGTLWFMFLTGNGLAVSLTSCVLPFLPGDALKIIAASLLVKRLRPTLNALV